MRLGRQGAPVASSSADAVKGLRQGFGVGSQVAHFPLKPLSGGHAAPQLLHQLGYHLPPCHPPPCTAHFVLVPLWVGRWVDGWVCGWVGGSASHCISTLTETMVSIALIHQVCLLDMQIADNTMAAKHLAVDAARSYTLLWRTGAHCPVYASQRSSLWLNLPVGENMTEAWRGADAAKEQAAMHAACLACSLLMRNSELSVFWARLQMLRLRHNTALHCDTHPSKQKGEQRQRKRQKASKKKDTLNKMLTAHEASRLPPLKRHTAQPCPALFATSTCPEAPGLHASNHSQREELGPKWQCTVELPSKRVTEWRLRPGERAPIIRMEVTSASTTSAVACPASPTLNPAPCTTSTPFPSLCKLLLSLYDCHGFCVHANTPDSFCMKWRGSGFPLAKTGIQSLIINLPRGVCMLNRDLLPCTERENSRDDPICKHQRRQGKSVSLLQFV